MDAFMWLSSWEGAAGECMKCMKPVFPENCGIDRVIFERVASVFMFCVLFE